jgi:cytochrome c2
MQKVFFLVFVVVSAGSAFAADSRRGLQILQQQRCFLCHSTDHKGTAANLMERMGRAETPSEIAGEMWNHAPVMWSAWTAKGAQAPPLTEADAEDLFAYLFAARYFEHLGEADRGKKLFDEKCRDCHSLHGRPRVGKPVSQWRPITDAFVLIQTMWNHTDEAKRTLEAKGLKWPTLTGQEVTDLVIYFQNVTGKGKTPILFSLPTQNGEALFREKGCETCHQGSQVLKRELCRCTEADVAARLWNHASDIQNPPQFTIEEMRSFVNWVWATEFLKGEGDANKGREKFMDKGCAECHDGSATSAPTLEARSKPYSSPSMVGALWQHRSMLDQMEKKHIPWPHFGPTDLEDITAYLNSFLKPSTQPK